MKAITPHSLAAEAAERWKKNYWRVADGWPDIIGGNSGDVYNALVALGSTPDPDDVNRIIGNDSWTYCRCNECGFSVPAIVQLGDEPDYESSTAYVCADCLGKAIELAKHALTTPAHSSPTAQPHQ